MITLIEIEKPFVVKILLTKSSANSASEFFTNCCYRHKERLWMSYAETA